MKKNNTAAKTALEAEKIANALKEGTEQTLRGIMNEAISNLMKEAEEDEEPEEDDAFDEEDVDIEKDSNDAAEEAPVEGGEEGGEEADGAEEDSALEDYKIGDDDYDLTGVHGDELLKAFDDVNDDDLVFIEKDEDEDGDIDGEENDDAELEIDVNPDDEDADAEPEDGEFELEFGDEDEGNDEDSELEFDDELGDEGDDDIEIELGDDEEEELNEENLGYTDSYQKDVFAKKFNMNEPANSNATNDWDEGAPKGSEKPWAGKGDGKPFEKKVNECGNAPVVDPQQPANLEENGGTISSIDARHMKKGQIKQHRPNAPEYDVRKEDSPMNEAIKKIIEKAKAIQAENKQYKEYVGKIKRSLYECAVLNVNMGKLVEILVNESATKDEKRKICERFNNVKTLAEGKALYDTIKGELNEAKTTAPAVEKQFMAESTAKLNEKTMFVNNPSLDLMSRMDNLFKK